MSEGSPRFCSWRTRDWVSQYGIIAFVCTVTSRRCRPLKAVFFFIFSIIIIILFYYFVILLIFFYLFRA